MAPIMRTCSVRSARPDMPRKHQTTLVHAVRATESTLNGQIDVLRASVGHIMLLDAGDDTDSIRLVCVLACLAAPVNQPHARTHVLHGAMQGIHLRTCVSHDSGYAQQSHVLCLHPAVE